MNADNSKDCTTHRVYHKAEIPCLHKTGVPATAMHQFACHEALPVKVSTVHTMDIS